MFESRRSLRAPFGRAAVVLAAVSCLGVAADPLLAASTTVVPPPTGDAVLSGVVSVAGELVPTDATVQLVELRRQTVVDDEGAFRFDALPAGDYLLLATSPRWGQATRRVSVAAGGTTTVELTLNLAVHHEAVVVTARSDARSLNELAQPVSVLSGSELRLRMEPTLGETLATQPGVASTGFGAGSSRPVIRGLGGDRIRVLQDGVGTGDASNTSPDHAVSIDPLSAEQIEVVRGPATLLYGSSAVGGVVNVIQDTIPSLRNDRDVQGSLDLFGGTVADEWGGRAALNVGKGPFVVHGDFTRQKSDDYSIPGFAESEAFRMAEEEEHGEDEHEGEEHEEEEGAFGTLPNSAVDTTGAGLGLSYVGGRGFLGMSVSGLDSLFGIPGGHAHGEEDHEHEGEDEHEDEEHEGEEEEHGHEHGAEEPIRSDLRQRRFDLQGELSEPLGGFRAARLRFGYADYEHSELEGDLVGTRFTNDSWEGRVEFVHQPWGSASGSFGLQFGSRDFEAVGEEAFVPPTETRSFAVFAFEEFGTGPWKLQAGARFEDQSVDAGGDEPASRSFQGFTGSLGTTWTGEDGWNAGLTLARSTKLPNAEELFSNGPHIATRAFEIGDPDLGKETSWGADLSLAKTAGRATVRVNLFANRFDDFIYEELTGEVEDGLTVVRYVQADTEFLGAEFQGTLDLIHRDSRHLDLEVSADTVRAELRDSGEPLPRIPPFRYGVGLHYRDQYWNGKLEVRGVGEQTRIAAHETPTDGYAFLNASLGYRFFVDRTVYELVVRGTNLTDEEGRNHLSFLKEQVPLPGRDVRLLLRVLF